MNQIKHHKLPSLIGAGISFIVFLVIGAIPSLLYGGYAGLILSNILFSHEGKPSIAASIVTGGGMLLGFTAVLSLFLVCGAFVGSLFSLSLLQPKQIKEDNITYQTIK